MRMLNQKKYKKHGITLLKDRIYKLLFYIAILFSIVILFLLLFQIVEKGISYLSINFFTNFASRNPKEAGIAADFVRDNIIYEYCYTCFFYIWSWNSTLFRAICEGISI